MLNLFKYIVSFLMIMVCYYIVSQNYPDLFIGLALGFFGWQIFMSTNSTAKA